MRKLLSISVLLLGLSGALLVAQEAFEFDGNYDDFRRLAPQTIQQHDFTFVRLMYNGRVPHYLKNWYTDYLVFINHNTDLMDASEWADDPFYPQKFAAYSYKIFSNAIVYALSH